ncbi:BTAD domain-containing putative transcriptional regulator [Streptosporangium sp. NPDC002524]|uniref:AfsR/SARP family transcriptional regulator n=1 Tax=Streptosporangium sp. NPDC002524 TaxID=3154537 RepID=UPI00331D8471
MRVWRDGDELEIGSPQQRLVLAVLLLAEGRTVGHDHLLDAVWGEYRPRTAMGTLRTYISRLRSVLGAEVITSIGSGYALSGGVCDLVTMEELSREERYGEALELWRGEPLAGLEGGYAESQRVRLGERRLAVLERRLAGEVEEGGHTEVIAELTALRGEHPARERLSGLLMLALYRSGRQAEAIGVYTDTRELLAESLGIDPSPELAELYRRIITADPALGHRREAASPAVRRVPRQLPADTADFTGRESEVDEVVDALRTGNSSTLVISAVSGAGGMGKTTLAVHVAHRLAPDYPDGQLFVNLRGSGAQPLAPETVLGRFLRSLGAEVPADAEDPGERAAMYRSTLADRRVLVVLDNAAGSAQVRPLLPGAAGCAVMVTSRAKMVGLSGVRQVDLGVLPHDEATALLARVVGEARVAAEREAAADLVGACGHLPLAIRIVASRLAARPAWSVARMRDRMADERRRLAELRVDDLAVEATFALGYDQLDAAHASAFRLLAVPDAADFSLGSAAAVLGLDEPGAEEVCEALVDVSMLESPSPGHYRYHDLLKIFARSRPDDEEVRRAALARLLGYHLAGMTAAYRLTYPGAPVSGPEPSSPGPSFADEEAAVNWAEDEEQGVISCVHQVARTPGSVLSDAIRLLDMASDVLETDVTPERYERAAGALVEAAAARGERRTEAHARCVRGGFWTSRWFLDAAVEDGVAARDLSLAENDPARYAESLNLLATAASNRGSKTEAIALYAEAVEVWRGLGDRSSETVGLGNMALALASADRTAEAVEAVELADRTIRELGGGADPDILYRSAVVLRDAGRPEEALSRLLETRTAYRRLKQRVREGATLLRMAETHLALGQLDRAVDCAEDSLGLMAEAGDEWIQGKALVALGQAFSRLGQPGRAGACLTEALEIFVRRDMPEADEVRALLDRHAVSRPDTEPRATALTG